MLRNQKLHSCKMHKRFAGTAKKLTPMQLEDLLSDGTTTKYWLVRGYWLYLLLYRCCGCCQIGEVVKFLDDKLKN